MAFTIDLRWLRVLSLRRPLPNKKNRWSVWPAGAMVVDRSDRKLINDGTADAVLLLVDWWEMGEIVIFGGTSRYIRD
jgi:hypothetical protein